MSISDITNYVRNTPNNTNPSVIRSMVKSEVGEYVEEASNEAICKLIENGQIGYTENFNITWDGNTDGKTSFDIDGSFFYKVSDRVLSATELTGAVVTFSHITNTVKVEAENILQLDGACLIQCALSAKAGDYDGLIIPEDGTYFGKDSSGYPTSLSKNVIHPMDRKYLPGVCLPVVELETAVDLTTDFTTLSSADTEALKDAVAKYQYAMFIVKVGAAAVPIICYRINGNYFTGSFAKYVLAILPSENGNARFLIEAV